MGFFASFGEPIVEPGARDRVNARLKDIPKINQERPCKTCAHYFHSRMIKCGLQSGACDFYHSGYKPITQSLETGLNEKQEDSGYNQC